MKVGFDYYPATTHAPGRGRYARELVRALVSLPPKDLQLRLLDLGRGERSIPTDTLGLPDKAEWLEHNVKRVPRRLVNWGDRFLGFGADGWVGGCNVFHHTSPAPLLVEHAIEILPVPELPPAESEASEVFGKSLDRIEHIVVFSNHLQQEIVRRYGWSTERVHVTQVGCDHWVRDLDVPPLPDDPPYLLVLGALREQRFPHRIRRSFERLRSQIDGLRLIFCGRPGDAAEQFLRDRRFSGARNDIEWIDRPNERHLPELVARASALVHLNTDEGTAVTVLEALRAGVPVVCSHLPALVEVLGNVAHYVGDEGKREDNTLDQGILAALKSSKDPRAREQRIALAAPFDWRRCATRTLELWKHVLETTPPRRR